MGGPSGAQVCPDSASLQMPPDLLTTLETHRQHVHTSTVILTTTFQAKVTLLEKRGESVIQTSLSTMWTAPKVKDHVL